MATVECQSVITRCDHARRGDGPRERRYFHHPVGRDAGRRAADPARAQVDRADRADRPLRPGADDRRCRPRRLGRGAGAQGLGRRVRPLFRRDRRDRPSWSIAALPGAGRHRSRGRQHRRPASAHGRRRSRAILTPRRRSRSPPTISPAARCGLPVHTLLGGAVRDAIPVTHSIGLIGGRGGASARPARLRPRASAPSRSRSASIPRATSRWCGAIRAAVGPGVELCVDANEGYRTPGEAIKTIRAHGGVRPQLRRAAGAWASRASPRWRAPSTRR